MGPGTFFCGGGEVSTVRIARYGAGLFPGVDDDARRELFAGGLKEGHSAVLGVVPMVLGKWEIC